MVQQHIDDIQACMSTSCPPPVDISNPLNSFDDDLADIAIPTPPDIKTHQLFKSKRFNLHYIGQHESLDLLIDTSKNSTSSI